MHIITWTNTQGGRETVKLKAADIDTVIKLCGALRADRVTFSHVFED